jgi:hypothetical protein
MKTLLLFLLCFFNGLLFAQHLLQPGYQGAEYRELLQIFSRQTDSLKPGYPIPPPQFFHRVYRSPVTGLKNRWELWYENEKPIAAISIRGTIQDGLSWLENFYAAMVPASGSLQINDSTKFDYRLAADSGSMVHVGWLLGLAHMAPGIMSQVRASYVKGYKDFYLFGHSQGGALAYLLLSYLHYQQAAGNLPADIQWKTYCSAAPKPGNLYYAYDFDFITRGGWAFNTVNSADWVPETPFSTQTFRDFNRSNPFSNIDQVLGRQSFFARIYLKSKFKKMERATDKAQKKFTDYLGKMVEKQVKKALPQYQPPVYAQGNNYQRAGVPIVLIPDGAYWKRFPNNPQQVFTHHLLEPYYQLSKLYYP